MKTVVFVDELLLVNFAAAAALLLGAGLLCGRSCTGLRPVSYTHLTLPTILLV